MENSTEHAKQASLVPDHRHRLPEQPAAHRHRVREARRRRAGPLSPHGGLRRLLPDGQRREHRQGVEAGRRAGPGPAGVLRRHGPAVPRGLGRARHQLTTTFIQTSEPRHHAVLPEVHPEGLRQRLHLQGQATRAGTATAARRSRPRRNSEDNGACPHPQHAGRSPQRAVLLLRAVEVPGPAAEVLRGESRLHPAGEPAERDRRLVQATGCRTSTSRGTGETWGIRVPFDDAVHDLRLVRRAAELHHRHRLRRPTRRRFASGGRPTCTSSARTSRASTARSGRRC